MTRIVFSAGALEKEGAAEHCALSVATMERLLRREAFPKPRLLADRRVGWLVRELDEWLEARPVADLPPPPNTGEGGRRSRRGAISRGQPAHPAAATAA